MQTACVRCGRAVDGYEPICDKCRGASPSNERPYDTASWRNTSQKFLRSHPKCALCGGRAQVSDHWPKTRKELSALGVDDVDADEHLRPLCTGCHARFGRKSRMKFDNDPA